MPPPRRFHHKFLSPPSNPRIPTFTPNLSINISSLSSAVTRRRSSGVSGRNSDKSILYLYPSLSSLSISIISETIRKKKKTSINKKIEKV
ncbi:hypothetical protein L2E82_25160 [Cichorium intybus]|uniref:Uncharacterized protein n=1 Tax=Cichorium intybus TaxID=13427 RepID=A0ACB9E351_CICIN|nr:hypothetical protein L2E82_25160 [Cichorium intybus]